MAMSTTPAEPAPLSKATLSLLQALSTDHRTLFHSAIQSNPNAVLAALSSAKPKHDTKVSGPRFSLRAVWPNGKQFKLISGLSFGLGDCVNTPAWVRYAARCVLGVVNPSHTSANCLSAELVLRHTEDPLSDIVDEAQDLAELQYSDYYLHVEKTVAFPESNDWKATKADRSFKLSEEAKGEIRGRADRHCVLTGRHYLERERGHECAHVIPAAIATEAFAAFVEAACLIDVTFPFLTGLDDPRNIVFIDLRLHQAIDAEGVGICMPTIQQNIVPSDPDTDPGTEAHSIYSITAPVVEFHHVGNVNGAPMHQTPMRDELEVLNERRRRVRDAGGTFKAATHYQHRCAQEPAWLSWFQSGTPWMSSRFDTYPHPSLLALHYGVFLAHNYGSPALKAIALSGKKRKTQRGGNKEDGSGKGKKRSRTPEEDDGEDSDGESRRVSRRRAGQGTPRRAEAEPQPSQQGHRYNTLVVSVSEPTMASSLNVDLIGIPISTSLPVSLETYSIGAPMTASTSNSMSSLGSQRDSLSSATSVSEMPSSEGKHPLVLSSAQAEEVIGEVEESGVEDRKAGGESMNAWDSSSEASDEDKEDTERAHAGLVPFHHVPGGRWCAPTNSR
ncbi:hypothetical protein DFH06DRAFT_1175527 [Mycena polygramma]|nr:hypothetical protein DFH06DRAFT_1175527 [Mycena polygramma]